MRLLLFLSILGLGWATNHKLRLAEDELIEYFGLIEETREAPEYEIVYIDQITSAKSARSVSRETIREPEVAFKLRAFNDDLHLEVKKDEEFLSGQTTSCMYLEDDGTEMMEDIPTDCFYTGNVLGDHKSRVTINTCAGITGTISREGHATVYIEPLRLAHAQKRGTDSVLGHVIYKAPKDIHTWKCGVQDQDNGEYREMGQMLDNNVQTVISPKYMKVHIVADHDYWAVNGDKSCKCIIATFQAVVHRMALLPNLNLLLSKVTIIKSSALLNTIPAANNLGVIRNWTDFHPDKAQWDHVALVVPRVMSNGTAAGWAYVCGMCGYNKVSVSYIGALYGVQVMAHEIGHNLCLSHDTGGFNCHGNGYVMGPGSWNLDMAWSQCSIKKYLEKINTFSCLNDP